MKDVSSTSSATDRSKETDQGNGPTVALSKETDQGNGVTVALCRAGNVDIPPFEFKVLEVSLEHTCKCLESEVHH